MRNSSNVGRIQRGARSCAFSVTSADTRDEADLRIACEKPHVRRELVAYLVCQRRIHVDWTACGENMSDRVILAAAWGEGREVRDLRGHRLENQRLGSIVCAPNLGQRGLHRYDVSSHRLRSTKSTKQKSNIHRQPSIHITSTRDTYIDGHARHGAANENFVEIERLCERAEVLREMRETGD